MIEYNRLPEATQQRVNKHWTYNRCFQQVIKNYGLKFAHAALVREMIGIDFGDMTYDQLRSYSHWKEWEAERVKKLLSRPQIELGVRIRCNGKLQVVYPFGAGILVEGGIPAEKVLSDCNVLKDLGGADSGKTLRKVMYDYKRACKGQEWMKGKFVGWNVLAIEIHRIRQERKKGKR